MLMRDEAAGVTASFRRMTAADRDFVISGWSSSYRTSFYAGPISMKRYASVMHVEVADIIDNPRVTTTVAYEPGETIDGTKPLLYGFVTVGDEPAMISGRHVPHVFYAYVRAPYRRAAQRFGLPAGYATQLLAVAGVDPARPFLYACRTPILAELERKIPLAEFNPLPARFMEPYEPAVRTEDRPAARGR